MRHLVMLAAAIFTIMNIAVAQEKQHIKARDIISDHSIDITWHKTTLLIFPAAIQDADRGDSYVLAERADGVGNVLKIKAGERDFEPSNLHVITTDGKVYAFTVRYCENPTELTIDMGRQRHYSPAIFDDISLNSRELELAAATIKGTPRFIYGVRKSRHGMELKLEGVFVRDDVLFFRYNLKNNTQIRHDAMAPRCYARDKKRAKRTAIQETEMDALFVQHSGSPEDSQGQTIIMAFPKFTIAESKIFVTEIMEQGGDRHMECKANQRILLRAKKLN